MKDVRPLRALNVRTRGSAVTSVKGRDDVGPAATAAGPTLRWPVSPDQGVTASRASTRPAPEAAALGAALAGAVVRTVAVDVIEGRGGLHVGLLLEGGDRLLVVQPRLAAPHQREDTGGMR